MPDIITRPALLIACLGVQALPLVAHGGTTHTVDVLGVYSDHTAQQVADPKALFVRNIEYANKALQNSGANYRYNLVHVQQQNWGSDDAPGGTQLDSFTEDPAIKQLRDDYGADLVAGMVPRSGSQCGIGWLPSANRKNQTFYDWSKRYGYSLSGHDCGGRTMAHEIGHTMGLGHSHAQGDEGTLAAWGRGHGVNGSFVTIMAYNSAYGVHNSAGTLQIHSNPSISVCNGNPCGISSDKTDGADAVQALNLASPQIAAWNASIVPDNKPPVAVKDNASTDADKKVTINVLQNDSDPDNDAITVSSVSTPANGNAVISTDGTQIAYTPDQGFDGNDSFSYTIRDSHNATATASVSVQVKAAAPGEGGGDAGLVVNGGAEQGLKGWTGAWGAQISLSNDAYSGNSSIQASGTWGGIFVDLHTPLAVNKNLAASGWLKADANTTAYVYLALNQDSRWRYQYMTTVKLPANKWTTFDTTRYVGGSQVNDGSLLIYFPRGYSHGIGNLKLDGFNVVFN